MTTAVSGLVTILALVLAVAPTAAQDKVTAPRPAYVERGDQVEARYQAYRQRLEREFDKLGPRLQAEAPDLHPKLKAATPEPVPYGYRILPKMIADLAPSVQPPRSTSISYSWGAARTRSSTERSRGWRRSRRRWTRSREPRRRRGAPRGSRS